MKDEYSVIGVDKNFNRVISEGITFEEALKVTEEAKKYFDSVSISLDYSMRNPSRNILVFSDCEMRLPEVKKLLTGRPEELKEQIIFLGNYISKDKGFIPFMNYLVKIKENGLNLIFVRGQNEHNLIEAMNNTTDFIGNDDYRKELIHSIEKQLGYTLIELKYREPLYYSLFKESYTYFEDEKHIFTSGGLDMTSYWRESKPKQLHITSNEFIKQHNNTGKTIVFGNRKVEELNGSVFKKPWINKESKKIAINGDIINKGRLIAISIIKGERYYIGIRHKDTRRRTYDYNIHNID